MSDARTLLTPVRGVSIGAALLLGALLVPALFPQKLPWHGRQAEVLAGVSRVLIPPPDVHVDEWSTTAGRELDGASDHVRRMICGSLDQMFEERKVAVDNYPLCLGEGEWPRERLDALKAARTRFRELVTTWNKPRHNVELLQGFHLGDEQETIKMLESDVMVMVCADGNLKTKGEKTAGKFGGVVGGSAPGEGILLNIGVIRTRTGELLYFAQKDVGGDFLKHEDKLEKGIEQAVRSAFVTTPVPGSAAGKAPGR